MITKEGLKIGLELTHRTVGGDFVVAGWDYTQNIIHVDEVFEGNSVIHTHTLEYVNKKFKLKPTEEWVDCPIIDISFATKDRVECRVKESESKNWKEKLLISVDELHTVRYPYFVKGDCYEFCQVKKSDLHKFEV